MRIFSLVFLSFSIIYAIERPETLRGVFSARWFEQFDNPDIRGELAVAGYLYTCTDKHADVRTRSYVMSFAIDLYDTLPPGGEPLPSDLPQNSDKGTILRDMDFSGWQDRRGYHSQNWSWIIADESRRGFRDSGYIFEYLHEADVKLAPYTAEVSLPVEQMDVENPRHFQPMLRWMAETVTAREMGIPPTEAVEWMRDQGMELPSIVQERIESQQALASISEPIDETVSPSRPEAVVYQPEPEQPKTEPQPEAQPAPAEKAVNSMILWGVLAALVIGVVGVIVGRRRG